MVLVCITGLFVSDTARADPARWIPGPVPSWQWQLTWPVNTTINAAVYDIDYDGSGSGSPAQVKAVVTMLHGQGRRAVCYLETAGWENYRPDAKSYPNFILGRAIDGWAGEKYVDVRQRAILEPILKKRFQQCRDAGFDGVETDIDDTYTANTGFRLTEADLVTFNSWVADDIHALGMAWFFKNGINGDDFITTLLPKMDGTVNEQCWEYGECAALAPVIAAGKPVLNTEYIGSKAAVCPQAATLGTTTMRKPLSLSAAVTWHCWP